MINFILVLCIFVFTLVVVAYYYVVIRPKLRWYYDFHDFYNRVFESYFPSEEKPERVIALAHIKPGDVVLEIGGGVGGVSEVIARNLTNSSNFVVVEPHHLNVLYLEALKISKGLHFHVFEGVLKASDATNEIECTSSPSTTIPNYASCKTVVGSSTTTINKTISELKGVYGGGLNFNAVVIDCEGGYESWLHELAIDPTIRKICIEWDGKFMEPYLISKGFQLMDHRTHDSLPNGVSYYER